MWQSHDVFNIVCTAAQKKPTPTPSKPRATSVTINKKVDKAEKPVVSKPRVTNVIVSKKMDTAEKVVVTTPPKPVAVEREEVPAQTNILQDKVF